MRNEKLTLDDWILHGNSQPKLFRVQYWGIGIICWEKIVGCKIVDFFKVDECRKLFKILGQDIFFSQTGYNQETLS